MHKVLIFGAGKIGSLIASMLVESGAYQVHIFDIDLSGEDLSCALEVFPQIKTVNANLSEHEKINAYIKEHGIEAIISCLPYFLNSEVLLIAKINNLHYFDLTEDVESTNKVKELAQDSSQAFVPQCGLAPGFISVVANSLMQEFDELESANLRVGALPQNSNHVLNYALTWSTDGLINEYANTGIAIKNGKKVITEPLRDLEHIKLSGISLEAFNTSGGLGNLYEIYLGKIRELNYKTIRYPGHCDKVKFLMEDLQLNQDRDTLKNIFEKTIPKTYQDLVFIYVSVIGYKKNTLMEKNYQRIIYPTKIGDLPCSAIQVTTAAGLCATVDIILNNVEKYSGFIYQENFSLNEFINNQFGAYYA